MRLIRSCGHSPDLALNPSSLTYEYVLKDTEMAFGVVPVVNLRSLRNPWNHSTFWCENFQDVVCNNALSVLHHDRGVCHVIVLVLRAK